MSHTTSQQRLATGALLSRAMGMGLRIKAAREHLGMDQATLARKSGVAAATISALEIRDSKHSAYVEQLLRAFPPDRISHDWVRTGRGLMTAADPHLELAARPTSLRAVPVVGTAKMGDLGNYVELSSIPGAGDGHIEIHTRDPNSYALRVRGDSMMPAIRDGWYVIVEPNSAPQVGEYVLLKLRDGRKMVKELLYRRSDSLAVISVNSGERLTVPNEELEDVQAVAAVIPPSKWRPE